MDDIPPIDQPMRYGNKAFRTWLDKVREVRFHFAELNGTIESN